MGLPYYRIGWAFYKIVRKQKLLNEASARLENEEKQIEFVSKKKNIKFEFLY